MARHLASRILVAILFAVVGTACSSAQPDKVAAPSTPVPAGESSTQGAVASESNVGQSQQFLVVDRPAADPPALVVLEPNGQIVAELEIPVECANRCQIVSGPIGNGAVFYVASQTDLLLRADLASETLTAMGDIRRSGGAFVLFTAESGEQQVLDTTTHGLHSVANPFEDKFNSFEVGAGWLALSNQQTVLLNPTLGMEILLSEHERLASSDAVSASGELLALIDRAEGALQVRELATGAESVWYGSDGISAQWIGDRLVVNDATANLIAVIDGQGEIRSIPIDDQRVQRITRIADQETTALVRMASGDWFLLDLVEGEMTARPELAGLMVSLFQGADRHVLLDNGIVETRSAPETYRLVAVQNDATSVVEVPVDADLITVMSIGADSVVMVSWSELPRDKSAELFGLTSTVTTSLPSYATGVPGFSHDGDWLAYTSQARSPLDEESLDQTSVFSTDLEGEAELVSTVDGRFLGWITVET